MPALAAAPVFTPPDDLAMRREGAVVHARLEAGETMVDIAGHKARVWAYSGHFPGPTLRLREGDTLNLAFTNRLPEPTNLHFHSMHIPPTGKADNVFRLVEPGATAQYAFSVPQGAAGVYWYHPHVHKQVSAQLFRGLAGAIVVEDSGPVASALQGVSDHLVVLKDIALTQGGNVLKHTKIDWMMGREGDLMTVNGRLRPHLAIASGVVRLRLVNASHARYYRLRIPHAEMRVIAVDGAYGEQRYLADELLLVPGQRYQVLARFPRAGMFKLIDAPYDRAPEMRGGKAGQPMKMGDGQTYHPDSMNGMTSMR